MRKVLTIRETERGLLFRDGRIARFLEPGRYVFWDVRGALTWEIWDVSQPLVTTTWVEVIEKNHPQIADACLEVVRVLEGEVAVVSYDGQPRVLVRPGETRYFWTILKDIAVNRINVADNPRLSASELSGYEKAVSTAKSTSPPIVVARVEQHEVGLAFLDGELFETLGPGRHGFWQVGRKVTARTLDTRPTPLEITAQEILTKDRVSLRLTLTCFVRVTDARKAALSTPDYGQHVYKLVQFAIREAVAGRTLDEVLNDRETVDAQVVAHVREGLGDIGVEVTELGVKDVILPGDMRELINKVVEAEKTAQANLIRRREETAATRSLLNTARLMDENPTLMRLKELESLERVTEKIGRIDVQATSGEGLDALMHKLVTLRPRET